MNANYFVLLAAIVLATGLRLSLAQARAFQFVANSMFNPVFIQPSLLSQQTNTASAPPPVEGRPSDRKGAGTRVSRLS